MTGESFHSRNPVCSGHISRKVGILGGSFNPAHIGHRHISLLALRKIDLDEVWWLVSPGNPLKDHTELEEFTKRTAHANQISAHPRIRVKTFEADRGLAYSVDTVRAIQAAYPTTRFVWLMGADNLISFHRWERWRHLADGVSIAVLDRPGYAARALQSPFSQSYQAFRVDEADARLLPQLNPPAWSFLRGRALPISSTSLRRRENSNAPSN